MTQRQSLTFGDTTWYYSFSPNSWIGAAPNATVTGKLGANNAIYGGGNDTLIGGGGGGDNTFYLSGGDVAVAGVGDGVDTIVSYSGNIVLPTGFADGILNHSGTITGNAGNDILTATGSGSHTLRAGTGGDVLVGSATGTDRFVITQGGGSAWITGFQHGADWVDLYSFAGLSSAGGFANVRNLMSQVGGNVVLTLGGGQTLTFVAATLAQFTSADFGGALRPTLTFGATTWYYGLGANAWPTTTPGKTITGTFGANNAMYGAGNDILVGGGGGGDNSFYLTTGDTAVAASGDVVDTITAYNGNITLPVGFANGVLSHAGEITGNAQNNILTATGTAVHTLVGGGGDDVLIGSVGGTDRFVMSQGGGSDVVMGFVHGKDTIELDNFAAFSGPAGFATLQQGMTQVGANLVIALGGSQTLTIANATAAQFTATDFGLPSNLTGWQQTFDDEFTTFNASADGHTTTWWAQSGTLAANHEAENYSNNVGAGGPFSDSNGILTITASPTSTAPGLPYTSGEITTARSFSQTYGYFEMSAELPAGQGMWPAFWLLPADGAWPPELDAMEAIGSNLTTIYETTHSAIGGPNVINGVSATVSNTSTSFHTYGVDWEPNTITYYFDGNAIGSVATPADMNQPMYMLVDLAVGGVGSWPGVPLSGASGQLKVDYVRAYASPTAVQPPLTFTSYGMTINKGDGDFSITGNGTGGWINLGNGNQSIVLTAPAGNSQQTANTIVTGDGNQSISLFGLSNNITTGDGTSTIYAGTNNAQVTIGATPSGTSVVTASGVQDSITSTGAGNVNVSGTLGSAVVSLGDGNDIITLGGQGNTVTVGVGTSVISAGIGQGIVHAGGGADTITVTGYNNVLDAGAGMNFLNGGSGSDVFMLNGVGQGLDTITGFLPTNHDILDLTRTLAGFALAPDLSNIGLFASTQAVAGGTSLVIDPTGGGTGAGTSVATLSGVTTSLAAMMAANEIRVGGVVV